MKIEDGTGGHREGSVRERVAALGLTFAKLRVVLLFTAVAAMACLLPAQADTYWHLRAGKDLFSSGHVVLTETYSHTARGLPWPNHEWLWQALSYGLYRLGGMPLLTAGGGALITLACAVAYRLMGARPSVNFVLALVGVVLASVVWSLRPQIASLLLLMLLVRLVACEQFLAIPLLFAIWANLHGAVAMGGAVLVTATGVAWFGDRRRFRRLLIVTSICGALTGLTPLGVGLWRFIGESMARSRQNQIMEWMPSYPRGSIEIAFWLAALALVAMFVRRCRRLPSPSWDDRVVIAAALVFVPLAARAVRNISPFFLLWMPAMSRLIGPDAKLPRLPRWMTKRTRAESRGDASNAFPQPEGSVGKPDTDHPRINLTLAVVGGAIAIAAVAYCWAGPLEFLGWKPVPAAVATAIRACPGPLYNRYDEGGFLIWFVPDVPVFIDSRQDPYPPELLTAHFAAEQSGESRDLFARHGIRCAALRPNSRVARHLIADGWRKTYEDKLWVVLNPPGAAGPLR